jgi:uncharacterized protein with PQ loop repeat
MGTTKHHPRVNKRKTKNDPFIDKLVYFAAIVGPLMTLPQIYDLWVRRISGVSVITWVAYLLIEFLWIVYGLKHHDRPIILVGILWVVMDIAVIAGAWILQTGY